MGEKICYACKKDNFRQGKQPFEKVTANAEVSYIPLNILNKQQYRELRVRDLSVQELCLGRIIIHLLLMLILSFSDDHLVIQLVLDQTDPDGDYKQDIQNTIDYLCACFDYDWNTLKKAWCINDEKILQIFQSVIVGIMKDSSKFGSSLLESSTGRL